MWATLEIKYGQVELKGGVTLWTWCKKKVIRVVKKKKQQKTI